MKQANTITDKQIEEYEIDLDGMTPTSGLHHVWVGNLEVAVVFNTEDGYVAQIYNEQEGSYFAEYFDPEFSKEEVITDAIAANKMFKKKTLSEIAKEVNQKRKQVQPSARVSFSDYEKVRLEFTAFDGRTFKDAINDIGMMSGNNLLFRKRFIALANTNI